MTPERYKRIFDKIGPTSRQEEELRARMKKQLRQRQMMLVVLSGCGRTAPSEEEDTQPVQEETSEEEVSEEESSAEENVQEETQPEEEAGEESAPQEDAGEQEAPAETPAETPEKEPAGQEDAADETAEAQSEKTARWDQILTDMAPYLENAQEQDMSTEERIKANVGLGYDQISQAVLYMGMPMETPTTTYFFMGQMADGADSQKISSQLKQVMEGWIETYKRGYLQGNPEYGIIVSGDLVFAVMHENAGDFAAICSYLKAL